MADQAKYAPAFGGRCTVATSKGKKVPTKPEFFQIVEGCSAPFVARKGIWP